MVGSLNLKDTQEISAFELLFESAIELFFYSS